ncbi:hypothetical protein ACHAXA_002165 [Cyclostephanos tholiformis]|uniref:Uncharacterized protein n=1 Tax=Cyclostephanos tholiformis TaxID=382380 RepID=A0ABD3RGR3_9STRA
MTEQHARRKTREELEAEQQAAKEQLQAILDSSRPKHLGYGITSGVGNIVGAAVGTAGILVLAPTLGLGVGLAQGGILGGAVGLVGGAVAGVVGGAALAVGGAVQGVTQIGKCSSAGRILAVIDNIRGSRENCPQSATIHVFCSN